MVAHNKEVISSQLESKPTATKKSSNAIPKTNLRTIWAVQQLCHSDNSFTISQTIPFNDFCCSASLGNALIESSN
jgi:hypothetical protein